MLGIAVLGRKGLQSLMFFPFCFSIENKTISLCSAHAKNRLAVKGLEWQLLSYVFSNYRVEDAVKYQRIRPFGMNRSAAPISFSKWKCNARTGKSFFKASYQNQWLMQNINSKVFSWYLSIWKINKSRLFHSFKAEDFPTYLYLKRTFFSNR